jgi:hypothetical protein
VDGPVRTEALAIDLEHDIRTIATREEIAEMLGDVRRRHVLKFISIVPLNSYEEMVINLKSPIYVFPNGL